VTGAVQASAVRLHIRILLRLAADYSTSATGVSSITVEAQLYSLPPLCETLRNRKVINTKSAR
jgi:hypothetical protein